MKKYDKRYDRPKKSCSVWLVIIALLVIFLLILVGIFYLKFKSNFHFKNYSLQTTSLDDSVKKQLNDQAGEKEVQIRVSEGDLSKILNTEMSDFPLKDPAVKITPEEALLTGKTSNGPLAFKVEVGIIPKVNNGKVSFDIKQIKTAGVSAPKVVADSVNEKLSNYLKQFSPTEDMKVKDVKMYSGYLIVTGERD